MVRPLDMCPRCVRAPPPPPPYLRSLSPPPLLPLSATRRWSEATHGISGPGVHYTAEHNGASNTALPITTSCSFNRSLWRATGNQIAREGRAFRNLGLAASTFWTPVINIVRDVRVAVGGRALLLRPPSPPPAPPPQPPPPPAFLLYSPAGAGTLVRLRPPCAHPAQRHPITQATHPTPLATETAGEDPLVSGQYAVNFVTGLEHATETPYPLQASVSCAPRPSTPTRTLTNQPQPPHACRRAASISFPMS